MKPFRVLHIFGRLSKTGGAERWILYLLNLLHKNKQLQFDFLVSEDTPPLTDEIRSIHDSKIHFVPFSRCPLPWSWSNPYLAGVRKVLRQEHYDAVHCHQFDLSGEILRIAAQENVPKRIMSVHATEYETNRFYRRWVHHLWGHQYICRYATDILPCSKYVSDSFRTEPYSMKKQILYTGINTDRFHSDLLHFTEDEIKQRSAALRSEFGIPEDAVVIGHIGRFARQKNHRFLIELSAEMCRSDKNIYAFLIGEGELLQPMKELVSSLGLANRILFSGTVDEPAAFITSLFDVFVLPSLYEGLPLSVCEALCGGLNVVMSDPVSDDLNRYFPNRITQLPLDAGLSVWQDAIRKAASGRTAPLEAVRHYEQTPFTLEKSLENLRKIYLGTKHTF